MIVEIKGSGQKVKFPDGMSREQMADVLRRKFSQPISATQAASDELTRSQYSYASPVNQSLFENTQRKIGELLFDYGVISDRNKAHQIGGTLATGLGFTPIGAAYGGSEAGVQAKEGDLLGALGSTAIEASGPMGDLAKAGVLGLAKQIKGYRGISSANRRIDPNITWFSEDESLAKGYSDSNRAFSMSLDIKNPFNAGDDKNMTTPRKFANMAIQQLDKTGIDRDSVKLIRDDFLSNYGDPDKQVQIIDFWASDDGKDSVANFLEDLGYDSIRLKEEGVETYGVLRLPLKETGKVDAF